MDKLFEKPSASEKIASAMQPRESSSLRGTAASNLQTKSTNIWWALSLDTSAEGWLPASSVCVYGLGGGVVWIAGVLKVGRAWVSDLVSMVTTVAAMLESPVNEISVLSCSGDC